MKLVVCAVTDRGLRRSRNEDSHGVWIADDPAERARRGILLVVADGMGGARAGDVASRLAVEATLRAYREAPGVNVLEELRGAFAEANRVIYAENAQSPEQSGMATTLTAAVIRGRDIFLGHVGDTRFYVLRGDRMIQVTEDHSLVALLVAGGELTPEEARVDPRRNLLTRSLGLAPELQVDIKRANWSLSPGDVLLISSDGLHGLVRDEVIADAVRHASDLDAALRDLVTLAHLAGGSDNITAVLARAMPGEDS